MKIVLVNYRYFVSGGPERYMFNIIETLLKNGHTVIPFSVKHKKNVSSEYEDYFMDAVGAGEEVYAHEYKRDFKTVSKVVGRIVYSFEAKEKLKRLINDVKPDLVYIVYFQNKMSCSVIDAAKELNIPVVLRISDFGHICQHSNSGFYMEKRSEICEKCLHGSVLNNVKYRCSDGSFINSVIKSTSLLVMRALDIKNKIDAYIFPSEFTMSKYLEYGIDRKKANFVPTFFNTKLVNDTNVKYDDYAVYVGRLVPEKGIKTLIQAFAGTRYKLKIIGSASDEKFQNELDEYLKDKSHAIEFLGQMDFNTIQKYLSECLFTIVPSEWYENLPNTVLESYAFKKCVVATDIGSLKESVLDEVTGLLFGYKDYLSLREKIEILFSNVELAKKYGINGHQRISTIYSELEHYKQLENIFENVVKNRLK